MAIKSESNALSLVSVSVVCPCRVQSTSPQKASAPGTGRQTMAKHGADSSDSQKRAMGGRTRLLSGSSRELCCIALRVSTCSWAHLSIYPRRSQVAASLSLSLAVPTYAIDKCSTGNGKDAQHCAAQHSAVCEVGSSQLRLLRFSFKHLQANGEFMHQRATPSCLLASLINGLCRHRVLQARLSPCSPALFICRLIEARARQPRCTVLLAVP